MAPSLLVSLIGLLLYSPSTLQHPIPKGDQQDIRSRCGQDSINAHQHSASELSRQQRRGEPGEEGAEERREGERLSADAAADTISKINPLTIADQVSQRLRKHGKQPSAGGDTVERNGAKDFGYSVIVVAGDPVRLPIDIHGKGVRVIAKEAKTVDGRPRKASQADAVETAGKKSSLTEEIVDGESLYSNKQHKEARVPKKYDVDPNFPVYDQDFNFMPDPFNGILDESYLKESVARTKGDREPHAILARSNSFAETDAETTLCDQSWRGPANNSTTTTTRTPAPTD